MCFNCGCGIPDDDMGSPDNITNHTFHVLAHKWNKSDDDVKKQVLSLLLENKASENPDLIIMFEKAAKAWGQSVEEAKQNTITLLKQELA